MGRSKKIGVYVHLPFCVRKCNYCDFLSFPARKEVHERYLEALLIELRTVFKQHPEYLGETIFIGGGTPSIVDENWIIRIMEAVSGEKKECTIEVNPGTISKSKLKAYRKAGVNRLSIGAQSLNDEQLKVLGRIHSAEDFYDTFSAAREAGFTNINVDLMSALPGQTLTSWQDTLKEISRLRPEHISAYSLIIEEGTPFFESCPELPDEEEERRMYSLVKEYLQEQGYQRYEISNYAMAGRECLHNTGYWRRTDYLGFGLGSSSMMDNIRWKNPINIEEYIRQAVTEKGIKREEVQHLSTKEQEEEFMFLGLRMEEGVSRIEFRRCFGKIPEDVYGNILKKLETEGLLVCSERIYLTDRGIDLSNHVLSNFLQD